MNYLEITMFANLVINSLEYLKAPLSEMKAWCLHNFPQAPESGGYSCWLLLLVL